MNVKRYWVVVLVLLGCGEADPPVGPEVDPPVLSSLEILSGDSQAAWPGTSVSEPLVVRALDQFGVALAGVEVNWVASGGGSTSAPTSSTGTDGTASVSWELGHDARSQTVSVSATGLGIPVTFSGSVALTGTWEPVAGLLHPVRAPGRRNGRHAHLRVRRLGWS